MIKFEKDGAIFNLRTAGIIIEDGYVFLERKESDDFWSIPGGRTEMLEKTEGTVIREYMEEIDAEIKIIRQVWLTEDFFVYNKEKYHEIGFYYLVELLTEKLKEKDIEHRGREGKEELIYKWFKLEDLDKIPVYPLFLKEGLKNIPKTLTKIIQE